jgi:hypothetical protein
MDLIANLTSQLGLDPDKAKGLAGAVLGQIEQGVGKSLGSGEASAFRSQVPELGEWQSKVAALGGGEGAGGLLGALGGGGLGGGLLGAAGSLLGGSGSGSGFDVGSLMALAGQAGLGGAAVQQLVPLVLGFLKERLDPELLAKIIGAVPGLQQLAGGAPAGGLAGALGGLFGR